MSDGEFQEGQTWEAFQALSFHRLDTIRVIVDVNGGQCDGPMESVMSIEPLAARLEAFGASVDTVNAHDVAALHDAITRETGKPHVVLAYSNPTQGIPMLEERRPTLHYLRFTGSDERDRYRTAYDSMLETS
jgi:transketolase